VQEALGICNALQCLEWGFSIDVGSCAYHHPIQNVDLATLATVIIALTNNHQLLCQNMVVVEPVPVLRAWSGVNIEHDADAVFPCPAECLEGIFPTDPG
jgi:hypothetical protein